MRSLVCCFVSMGILSAGWAQAQTIDGIVLDDATRGPIAGVAVTIVRSSGDILAQVETDTTGRFHAVAIGSRHIIVRLVHPFYTSYESAPVTVRYNERVSLEVLMARGAVPLEPLIVRARARVVSGGFRERARTDDGWGHFITRSEIDARGETRPTELLRSVHLIDLAPTAHCFGCTPTNLIFVRTGGSRCLATIYVNGINVRQKEARPEVPGDFAATIDELIPSGRELEGVEVYARGTHAPAELAPINNCGVVAFWTRDPASMGRFTWKKLVLGLGGVAVLTALVR